MKIDKILATEKVNKEELINETNAQFLERMKSISKSLQKIKIDINNSNSKDLPNKH